MRYELQKLVDSISDLWLILKVKNLLLSGGKKLIDFVSQVGPFSQRLSHII